eukprot:gi/632938611/ref/XP_007905693.1/ PREDICTED: BCL2/adenovirus E1B 19 kDa protein-interacting protein 2 isoform X3 [Callorhinchus milii]
MATLSSRTDQEDGEVDNGNTSGTGSPVTCDETVSVALNQNADSPVRHVDSLQTKRTERPYVTRTVVPSKEGVYEESAHNTIQNQAAQGAEALLEPNETQDPDNDNTVNQNTRRDPVRLGRQESVATTEARLRMEGVELKEEWQDEDFPRPLPEDVGIDIPIEGGLLTANERENRPAWSYLTLDQPHCDNCVFPSFQLPSFEQHFLEFAGNQKRKTKLAAPDISLTLDRSDGSILSEDFEESADINVDDLDTPSDGESLELPENSNEFEWEDDLPKPSKTEITKKGAALISEYGSDEKEERRQWRLFRIGEQDHRVDMTAVEPYKKVISHGGYYGDGLNAIIVFAVCFMPDSSQPNYQYIMENLFKYIIATLELLVAENYMIVYLNGATTRRKMPSFGWLRKCYQMINRKLRKNLKSLMIVHPSWFIRTLLAVTRPFISSKFVQKVKYVFSLAELANLIPMEYVCIPDCIKTTDQKLNGQLAQP